MRKNTKLRNKVSKLKSRGFPNAEIARMVGVSRERISQIIGKSPEAEKKYKAREILKKAVKKGAIIRQPCQTCGDAKSEAHHTDYDKPLDVIWFCRKHHREIHAF